MTSRFLFMHFVLLILISLAAPVFAQDDDINATAPDAVDSADTPVIPADYREEGMASWYGDKFQGKVTASGETYDMDKMTAAHNYLPLGVKVTVTNLSNNKSVVVVINDRGPFVPDRILDLSRAAAKELGFMDTGKAKVRIEPYREVADSENSDSADATEVSEDSEPEVVAASAPAVVHKKLYGAFYIQAGAYKVKANAERLIERLHKAGFTNTRVLRLVTDSAQIFKVQIGMYKTLASVRAAHRKLGPGFPGTFVLADVIQD